MTSSTGQLWHWRANVPASSWLCDGRKCCSSRQNSGFATTCHFWRLWGTLSVFLIRIIIDIMIWNLSNENRINTLFIKVDWIKFIYIEIFFYEYCVYIVESISYSNVDINFIHIPSFRSSWWSVFQHQGKQLGSTITALRINTWSILYWEPTVFLTRWRSVAGRLILHIDWNESYIWFNDCIYSSLF